MKISLFIAACLFTSAAAMAQTTPRPAAPATMAAPTTERSSMTTAAEGVGTVVTDRKMSKREQMRDGQSRTKTTRTKSSDGNMKMKTKM